MLTQKNIRIQNLHFRLRNQSTQCASRQQQHVSTLAAGQVVTKFKLVIMQVAAGNAAAAAGSGAVQWTLT
jgi:hypothetical protein